MKNLITLCVLTLLLFSCAKKGEIKEVEEENKEVQNPSLKENTTIDEVAQEEVSKLIFTVQIAALKKTNEQLANTANVNMYQENSFTKYRLGLFKTYKEARAFRKQILKDYRGAFVQAVKNNEPITITEALQ
jgi:vacuolar-type H+-ATPase subunit I/STV1